MMSSTSEADVIGDFLRNTFPEFGDNRTLVIHVNSRGKNKGEISDKHLGELRRLAKEVDEDTSPVNAIVSVLMLREGWDVKNVKVVVGLRSFRGKANILREQTIGRGLRLMFRGDVSPVEETLDILGNDHFLQLLADFESKEGWNLKLWIPILPRSHPYKLVTMPPKPNTMLNYLYSAPFMIGQPM